MVPTVEICTPPVGGPFILTKPVTDALSKDKSWVVVPTALMLTTELMLAPLDLGTRPVMQESDIHVPFLTAVKPVLNVGDRLRVAN